MKRRWTVPEINRARTLAETHSLEEVAAMIGRSVSSVKHVSKYYDFNLRRLGEMHPRAKFSDQQVRAVRDMAARNVPQVDIAAGLGISQHHVGNIVNGRRRRAA